MGNKQVRFLIMLFLIISSLLCIIFSINYLVNPYKYFTRKGILSNGNFQTYDFFEKTPEKFILYKLKKDIKNTDKSKIIIGSSRVLLGFNTCETNYLKVGTTGIKLDGYEILLEESLKNKDIETIFIELGVFKRNNKIGFDKNLDFWTSAFSYNTLYISIKSIIAYLLYANEVYTSPNCNLYNNMKSYLKVKEDKYIEYYKDYFLNKKDKELIYFVNDILKIREKVRSNKEIVFFIAPINKKITLYYSKTLNTIMLKKYIKNNYNNVKLVNYSNFMNLLGDNDLWFDLNHFRPILGNEFLKSLDNNM